MARSRRNCDFSVSRRRDRARVSLGVRQSSIGAIDGRDGVVDGRNLHIGSDDTDSVADYQGYRRGICPVQDSQCPDCHSGADRVVIRLRLHTLDLLFARMGCGGCWGPIGVDRNVVCGGANPAVSGYTRVCGYTCHYPVDSRLARHPGLYRLAAGAGTHGGPRGSTVKLRWFTWVEALAWIVLLALTAQ